MSAAAANSGTPAYIQAPDRRVCIKNYMLFGLSAGFLIWHCIRFYSVIGIAALAFCLLGMFISGCCVFPKTGLPLHSVKFKAGHFLFWTVLSISAVTCCKEPDKFFGTLQKLAGIFRTPAFYVSLGIAVAALIVSEKIKNRWIEKSLHMLSALCVIYAVTGSFLRSPAIICIPAALTVIYFLFDLLMIAENRMVSDSAHYATFSPIQLAGSSIAAVIAFLPYLSSGKPLLHLSAGFPLLPFFCLLGAACGMAIICARFQDDEHFSNGETAMFTSFFFLLILLEFSMKLPFAHAFLIPVIYAVLSVPFLIAVGGESALNRFAASTKIKPFGLLMLLSVLAAASHLMLYYHLRICTAAVLISVYLMVTGSALSVLNQHRFRWHASPVVIFLVFLAICIDFRMIHLRTVMLDLVLMLLIQGAVFLWDDQFSAEQKAQERCGESAKALLAHHRASEKQQKLLCAAKVCIVGGYGILTALLLQKLMLS